MKAPAKFRFLLYTADHTPNSGLAKGNLAALCENHLAGDYEIETVDVLKEPKRALADRIFMTPILIRLAPLPVVRIVGTLSHKETILNALGVKQLPV